MCDCNRNRNRSGDENSEGSSNNGRSGCGRNRDNEVLGLTPICCNAENPFYPENRVCCDCDGECCGCFNQTTRDCFWPDFTHPSWLCCEILYSCPGAEECPKKEHPIDEEDRYEDNICEACGHNGHKGGH